MDGEYKQPIFYKTNILTLEEKIEILDYCKSICYKWWVDKLDCKESFTRAKD